jgi:uncharacterized Tic20 family protein
VEIRGSTKGGKMTEAIENEKFCVNCGTKINSKAVICPSCGVQQSGLSENVSSLWYLVPLFFGFLGGIVAWAVNKDRDPKKARNMLIFGIIWTVLLVLLMMLLGILFAAMVGSRGGY